MPVTDILNPTTVLTNNAVVSSANALAVKVISGGGSGITIDTTAITGGTTTRLLYDNGGTVGETAAVTYASASVTLALSSLAILGFLSSASVVDAGISRVSASLVAVGTGVAGNAGGTIAASNAVLGNKLTIGQTALNSAVPFYLHLGTDLNFGILSAGGVAIETINDAGNTNIPLSLFVTTFALNGQLIYGGVTFASTVTGSGSLVGATNPTLSSLVASGTLTYGGVTFASTVTGSGSLVGATGPSLSSLVATGTLTYGGVALSSTVTGTGSMVLSASPTLSGTASFAATVHSGLATFSSAQTTVGTGTFQNAVAASASVVSTGILFSSTASFGIIFGALGSVAPTLATSQGTLLLNTTGSSVASRMFIRTSSSWSAVTTAA